MGTSARVYAVARHEVGNFRPRLHLALLLSRLLPDLVGIRVRTAALRFAGVRIGIQSTIGGPIGIAGPGRPEERLVIGNRTWINAGCYFDASDRIEIGNNVAIAQQVTVLTQTHDMGGADRRAGDMRTSPVRIDDGCWIGSGVLILPGVTVGHGAIVAAGAVVREDVPPNALVGGVPARVIRDLGRDG